MAPPTKATLTTLPIDALHLDAADDRARAFAEAIVGHRARWYIHRRHGKVTLMLVSPKGVVCEGNNLVSVSLTPRQTLEVLLDFVRVLGDAELIAAVEKRLASKDSSAPPSTPPRTPP